VSGAPEAQGVKVARIEFKGLAVAVIRRFISSQEGVDGPAEGVFRSFVLQRGPNHKNAQAEAEDDRKTHQDKFHFNRHFKGGMGMRRAKEKIGALSRFFPELMGRNK
jgi:hypothetical protein